MSNSLGFAGRALLPSPPPCFACGYAGREGGEKKALRERTDIHANSYSIVNQPDAYLQTRVIAPVFISARGSPSSFCPLPLEEGRAERQGEEPRPRRPHLLDASTPYAVVVATSYGGPARLWAHGEAQLKCRKTTQAGPASDAVFACVPHADGLFGLLDVPGMATYASVPPFVRAVARTCTRAVRPCYRRLPRPLWKERTLPCATEPDIVADLRIPLPRLEDDRNAPLGGAGWTIKYSYLGIKSKLILEAVERCE